MLFARRFLDGIAEGTVELAYRRWRRPTVKAGGRLRTRIGELAVGSVERVEPDDISDADARRAGYRDRRELLRRLERRRDGEIYRVELRLAGPDPRVALRERADLGDEEVAELRERLAGMDARSRHGPWTVQVLELIRDRPETPSEELAASLGREKLPFKRDVRRLKELGLTESLKPGYRLSPRGRALLERL